VVLEGQVVDPGTKADALDDAMNRKFTPQARTIRQMPR
jgi:hypothetical protein